MTSDEYTNQELMLPVGDGHELYVQDWGNKDANVVVFQLHGGPGDASSDSYKSKFDPKSQRIVFFDQRGCGKSTPSGALEGNTTDALVEDITKIAERLGIDSFVLHGTSWGSTLALAYAVKHPERVDALVIGGIFTGAKVEIEWLDKGLMKTFYPDVWERYVASVPQNHRDDPSAFHFDRVLNGSDAEQKESGYAYENLEVGVMLFDGPGSAGDYETYDPTSIRIEIHYLANGCFMPDRYIFENADKLTMPVHIVQGRYDMVCPPHVAYELAQILPNAKLYWTMSNHRVEHEGKNLFRAIFNGMTAPTG